MIKRASFFAIVSLFLISSASAFQRNILIEEFTSEVCSHCPDAALILNDFAADTTYRDHIVIISYHCASDPWFDLDEAHFARLSPYDIRYIPHAFMDGINDFIVSERNQFVSGYSSRIGVESPIDIEIGVTEPDENGLTITAYTQSADEGLIGNYRMRFALITKEYNGFTGTNDQSEWHYDMLYMKPSENGLYFNIAANSTNVVSQTFPWPITLNGDVQSEGNIMAIVFVQSETTLEVVQSEWVDISLASSTPAIEPVPVDFVLEQNYPNPFNPSTDIAFSLPTNADVNLTVYDVSGREVATLVNGIKNSGSHKVSFDASDLASGVYFYTLNATINGQVQTLTRKLVLMK